MIAFIVACLLAAPPPAASSERWAVVVGNNDGGSDRPMLRWAVRDAEQVALVLGELGDVPSERATLLREPDPSQLERALDAVTGAIVRARARGVGHTELIVYYSGHADPAGLLLGSERFTYARLRAALAAVPADVAVVILDACASGAMLRPKGGTPVRSFLDDGTRTKGHAYVTSAAADEAAQESDRLQASFFTHHLVAGLRGAADRSGDQRVTLLEAYDHAFRETLAVTAGSLAGPQHPSYDIALAGQGDLVLTELAGASRLVLSPSLGGRVFVRDGASRLVAEVDKKLDESVTLALAAGPYHVAVVVERRVRATSIVLSTLPHSVALSDLVDRGPAFEARERGGTLLVDALPRAERSTALRLSLVPLYGFEGLGDDVAVNGLAFALLADRVASVRGVQLAGIYAEADDVVGLQLGPVVAAGVVRGSQLGLVTYAKKVEGVALALVPWVDDGVHVVEAWADSRGSLALGYRLGPRHLYVAGQIGLRPWGDLAADADHDSATLGLALGTRVALGPLDLDLDLGARFAWPGTSADTELVGRALVGWRFAPFAPGLALFAGGAAGVDLTSGGGKAFGLLGLRYDR